MIISKPHANYLWFTSWWSLIACIYGLWRGHTIAVIPGMIFITSINYWRDPIHDSYRRYIDIGTVVSCSIYQNFYAIGAEYSHPYYILVLIGFTFYPFARYLSQNGHSHESVIAHSVMHILCNIANMILYSGYTDPPWYREHITVPHLAILGIVDGGIVCQVTDHCGETPM